MTCFVLQTGCADDPKCEGCDVVEIIEDGPSNNTSESFCGDGVVDDGEACDDGEANGSSGACDAECSRVNLCGNGTLDDGEECDGDVDFTCESLGFDGGSPTCTQQCLSSVTTCTGTRSLPNDARVVTISPDETQSLTTKGVLDLRTLELRPISFSDESGLLNNVVGTEFGWIRRDPSADEIWIGTYEAATEVLAGTNRDVRPWRTLPDGSVFIWTDAEPDTFEGTSVERVGVVRVTANGDVDRHEFYTPGYLSKSGQFVMECIYTTGSCSWRSIDEEKKQVLPDLKSGGAAVVDGSQTHVLLNDSSVLELETGELIDFEVFERSYFIGEMLVGTRNVDCEEGERQYIFVKLATGETHVDECREFERPFRDDDLISLITISPMGDRLIAIAGSQILSFETESWEHFVLPFPWLQSISINGSRAFANTDENESVIFGLEDGTVMNQFNYELSSPVMVSDGWAVRSLFDANGDFPFFVNETTITQLLDRELFYAWRPDRRALVYVEGRSLIAVGTESGDELFTMDIEMKEVEVVSEAWIVVDTLAGRKLISFPPF